MFYLVDIFLPYCGGGGDLVMSDSCNPMDCSPPGYRNPWDFPGKNTGLSCHCLLQDFPNPGIEPGSPAL